MNTVNQESILRMIAENKITPEEGARLLEALEERPARPVASPAAARPAARPGAGKFLRVIVKVDASENTKQQEVDVDINLPLRMAHKIAPMLDTMIPEDAKAQMGAQGFDIAMIAELLQSLDEDMEGRDLVNVTASDGEEGVRVRVYVE